MSSKHAGIYRGDELKIVNIIDSITLDVEFNKEVVALDTTITVQAHKRVRLSRVAALPVKEAEAKTYLTEALQVAKETKLVLYNVGKYGTYFCDLFIDGTNFNNVLLEKGLVTRHGRKKS